MQISPPTEDEKNRIAALYRYNILDTEFEKSFDDIAKVAAGLCDTPIALISLVDPERQWFKAACGLGARETSRDIAFCSHAIHGKDVLIVPDTLEDSRFHDNPLVMGDPKIRFYAGAPLITNDGYALGTLCTIDRVPRTLSSEQIKGLEALAREVCVNLELRLQTNTLKAINEGKNRLFSVIAHDLRSPLLSLNSIVDHLEGGFDDMSKDEILEWLKHIKTSANTSLKIADNLLKWACFEDGNFHFDPKEIDMDVFTDEIRPVLEGTAKSKEIHLNIQSEAGIKVVADQTMLHSIVQNLISNAIKFTPKEGLVSLKVSADENSLFIEIVDTGCGMASKTLENLFDIEKTYSAEGTDGEKGSGLGLSLCKQFAEQMNGKIDVDSKEGEGTVAKLTLPLSI
ncbi:MAG: signal transduction histidine kinase [Candidatus Pelagisphaera sp.]|jgi:signal transduction histidine kinase